MNRWGIPAWLKKEVKDRDKDCIYCGIQMIEQMPPSGPWKKNSGKNRVGASKRQNVDIYV